MGKACPALSKSDLPFLAPVCRSDLGFLKRLQLNREHATLPGLQRYGLAFAKHWLCQGLSNGALIHARLQSQLIICWIFFHNSLPIVSAYHPHSVWNYSKETIRTGDTQLPAYPQKYHCFAHWSIVCCAAFSCCRGIAQQPHISSLQWCSLHPAELVLSSEKCPK